MHFLSKSSHCSVNWRNTATGNRLWLSRNLFSTPTCLQAHLFLTFLHPRPLPTLTNRLLNRPDGQWKMAKLLSEPHPLLPRQMNRRLLVMALTSRRDLPRALWHRHQALERLLRTHLWQSKSLAPTNHCMAHLIFFIPHFSFSFSFTLRAKIFSPLFSFLSFYGWVFFLFGRIHTEIPRDIWLTRLIAWGNIRMRAVILCFSLFSYFFSLHLPFPLPSLPGRSKLFLICWCVWSFSPLLMWRERRHVSLIVHRVA